MSFSSIRCINSCIKHLIYEYLCLEPRENLEIRKKWALIDFGLKIGNNSRKKCKYNKDGICVLWYWESPPKVDGIKFFEYEGLFGNKVFHSQVVREICVFCDSYTEKIERQTEKPIIHFSDSMIKEMQESIKETLQKKFQESYDTYHRTLQDQINTAFKQIEIDLRQSD